MGPGLEITSTHLHPSFPQMLVPDPVLGPGQAAGGQGRPARALMRLTRSVKGLVKGHHSIGVGSPGPLACGVTSAIPSPSLVLTLRKCRFRGKCLLSEAGKDPFLSLLGSTHHQHRGGGPVGPPLRIQLWSRRFSGCPSPRSARGHLIWGLEFRDALCRVVATGL